MWLYVIHNLADTLPVEALMALTPIGAVATFPPSGACLPFLSEPARQKPIQMHSTYG